MDDNRIKIEALQKALYNSTYPSPPQLVRISTKRSRRSAQFAEISKKNTEIVDQLADLAEQLAKNGQSNEVKSLINIIREILSNNQKLQEVVGEALLDIPN